MKVSDVVRTYLSTLETLRDAGRFSADHLENIRRDLTRFATFIGDKEADACRQTDLSGWVTQQTQWKSVCTKRNAVTSVIGCWRWAVEEQLVDRCPFIRPRSLRSECDRVRRPATEAEYLTIRRQGSRPLAVALWFLWNTGARTCEMRLLKWDDVPTDGNVIVLKSHKTARKTGRARVIPLSPVVSRVLRMMRRKAKSSFVFTNNAGSPWTRRTFATHVRRSACRLGMDRGVAEKFSAYCLRHSFACEAIKAGFTSKEVADQLGHVDSTMVERVYGSHTKEDFEYLARTAASIRKRR